MPRLIRSQNKINSRQMTRRWQNILGFAVAVICCTASAGSVTETAVLPTATTSPTTAADQWQLLNRAQTLLKTLNFDLSFVQMKSNQLTTFRWLHGIKNSTDGTQAIELERLILQDGVGTETIRRADKVYYTVPGAPTTVTLNHFIRELPTLLFLPLAELQRLYDAIPGSSIAISGRQAQLIRLSARTAGRYDYWVWLDAQTGFPLRIDTVDQNNQVLERWVAVHLQVKPEFPSELADLVTAPLPEQPVKIHRTTGAPSSLQLRWQPDGYQTVEQPDTVLTRSSQLLASWLLSDGMHQVSVFVQPASGLGDQLLRDGATTILVNAGEQYDVTVIGPIAPELAQQIAVAIE